MTNYAQHVDAPFLFGLSEALRRADSPIAVQEMAQRMLGEHLGATRVGYAEDVGDGERVALTRDWTNGAPSLAGVYRYADYGAELLAAITDGRTCVRPDIARDPVMSPEEIAAHLAIGLAATLNVPLVKNGRPVAIFAVHYDRPHHYDAAEIALVEATAEQTWSAVERARAEAALRASEERYRTLFKSMDEGYCVIEVLYDDAGRANDWRFLEVNPAFEKHNGLTEAAGKRMRALNPAIEHKWIDIYAGVAETGESVRFEESSAALGDRIFDLYAFRVGEPDARTIAVLFKDITQQRKAEDELRASESRLRVVVAELQHRVRNMLTVVRSVFNSTAETNADLDQLTQHFTGRLDALARTQMIVTRTAVGGVDLDELVRDELLSVGFRDEENVVVRGPDVTLTPVIAETLGLAVHELTTNALKYGALRHADATLTIAWEINMDQRNCRQLTLTWRETGVPAVSITPARSGFGRELIEQALPYRLGADTRLEFRGGGVLCTISVPLGDGASTNPRENDDD